MDEFGVTSKPPTIFVVMGNHDLNQKSKSPGRVSRMRIQISSTRRARTRKASHRVVQRVHNDHPFIGKDASDLSFHFLTTTSNSLALINTNQALNPRLLVT